MIGQMYSMDYSPVGDLTVVSVCFVIIVLMFFSYMRRSSSYRVFIALVFLLICAALSNVSFHKLAVRLDPAHYPLVYGLRCLYHALLYAIFFNYILYICLASRLEKGRRRIYLGAALGIFLVVMLVDVADTIRGASMQISAEGIQFKTQLIFFIGYVAYVALGAVLLAEVRDRIYKRVMMGFYGTMAVSFMMMLLQGRHGQSSYTVATFLYPVIAMFYILHSNPYDAELGAIDIRSLEDIVRDSYQRKQEFVFMSLYMRDFDEEGKQIPSELQALTRKFATDYFRSAMLFLVGPGHMMLLAMKKRNPDYEKRIERMLFEFGKEYSRLRYDYKIVIGESIDDISRNNEYVSFIRSVHHAMEENTIRRVDSSDVKRFKRYEYILLQLEDIYNKRDLNDPRVLTYCQPVYNIKTGRYDTAEALMRLSLDEIGMVFPDKFIPMAEENGYIHVLTEIILHKTCLEIRRLLEKGYDVCRISVNVSALELADDSFCDDIIGIISANGISGDMIAIELTESRTDLDFMHTKNMISQLRGQGIKFYLDDFGTGYSNMERIMELPFDIIKFDRTMVIASESSERSKEIVLSLANMFARLDYAVLYEGVEKDSDERMCIDMAASYLQGYKYSRPVPIDELERYFVK